MVKKFFTEEDFDANDNFDIELTFICGEMCAFINNFFKYPDRVREYVTSCPTKDHRLEKIQVEKSISKEYLNGKSYYDAKTYLERVSEPNKAELLLYQELAKIFNSRLDPVRMFNWRTFNQFYEVETPPKPFFWPHQDSGYNMMVYLNPHNHMGAGTTFYKKKDYKLYNGMEHCDSWWDEEDWEECDTILDHYNCMTIFPGTNFHSCRIIPDVHKDDMRITYINFFGAHETLASPPSPIIVPKYLQNF